MVLVSAATVSLVVVVAVVALLVFDAPVPRAAHELGALGLLLAGLDRWDANAYLTIAHDGYGTHGALIAYFPLYPLVTRVLGGFSSAPSMLVAGWAISIGCFALGLLLLRRLVAIELGEEAVRPTLVLLALFPAALFFVVPYPHSLFLVLAVGSMLAARTGRWAVAAVLATFAATTRPNGITLVVPLVLLYLYGPRRDAQPIPGRTGVKPRYALRCDALWLLLVPLGLFAYLAYLWLLRGDLLGYLHSATGDWHLAAAPFGAVWHAADAAVRGAGHLLFGTPAASVADIAQHHAQPVWVAIQNLYLFGFLIAAAVAAVGVWRTLPVAYSGYVLASAVLILSFYDSIQPLMSFPRYLLAVFPLFMWLGYACRPRRRVLWMAVPSTAGLVAFTAAFAAGRWVA